MTSIILNVIVPIFIVIGLSAWVDRRFKPNLQSLSSLIIYLLAPALVVDGLIHTDLKPAELLQIGAMAFGTGLAMWLVGGLIARALRLERRLRSAFLLSVVMNNCGNFGIPFITLAFGAAGEERAIVYTVAFGIVINTVGVYLASSGQAPMRESLLNVLKVPLLYATIIGLAINLAGLPVAGPLDKAIGILADAAVPVQLVLLGMQMAHTSIKGRLAPLGAAVFSRLVLSALVAIPLAGLLGLSGLTRQVSILESSMPSGVMGVALATEFDGDAEFVSAVILATTVGSIVTLSILLALLT